VASKIFSIFLPSNFYFLYLHPHKHIHTQKEAIGQINNVFYYFILKSHKYSMMPLLFQEFLVSDREGGWEKEEKVKSSSSFDRQAFV
jgi:hypothetical protein